MGPLSLRYKAFLGPLLTYASPGWFPFWSVTNITKLERLHRASSRAIIRCLSTSPIPLLLCDTSLPPLQVSLTHFALSSHKRALRFPTFLPISGLARLEVKPRLCRSSWRAFAFTFPSTSPREALLACPPSPTWNLPCFTVQSTLSSPCSLALIPFSLAKVRLSLTFTFLPTHDLVLWTDGSVPFPFGKGGSGVLANCSRCGTEATLSFSIGPVCSRYSAEACAILQALFLVSAAPTSLPFFFPFFSSLTPALSLPPCLLLHLSFYLNISGRYSRNCVLSSPVLSGYNGSPDTRFSQGTMRLMIWPDGERYSYPLQSLVVSLFHLSHPPSLSRIGGVFFYLNSSAHSVPQFSLRSLIVLPRHARCVLPRLRCNRHSLMLSCYLFRIGKIKKPCSACGHSSQDTSYLILHCPAMDSLRHSLFGDSLSLYDLWSRPWRVTWLLGLHGLPLCPHPLEGVG